MKRFISMFLTAILAVAAYSEELVPMAKLKAPQKASVTYLDVVGQYIWFFQTSKELTTDLSSVTSALTSVEVSIQPSETTENGVTISGMFPNDLEGKVVNLAEDGPCLEIKMGQMGGTDDFYGDYTIEGMNYFDEDDVPAGWYRQDLHGMIGDDAITFDSWIVTRLTGSTGQYAGFLKQPLYIPGSTLSADLRLVELPAGVEAKTYSLTYTDYYNNSVNSSARVAVDGDDVYFQGMSKFFPEAWVKGKKVGDKVKFPMKQYVGEYPDYGLTFAFCNCPVEFTYDETADTYSFEALLYGVVGGRYYDGYFNAPVLKGIDDKPMTPANPEITTFAQHDDGGWYILFNLPKTDTEGTTLLSYNLSYEIYSDIEGEVKPLTFTPETHTKLHENMTEIPYGFSDGWDFGPSGGQFYVFFNGLYSVRWNKIGIKSIYRGGGETRESDIQWYNIKPYTWGERYHERVPTYSISNYSLTQQIYTNADFGEAKTITSISFYNRNSERMRNFDIYLVTLDPSVTTFATKKDWKPFRESDKVFSGAIEFKRNEWTAIPFMKPFYYDGTSNVVLVVNDKTGNGDFSLFFRVYDAAGQCLTATSGSECFNADDLESYTGISLDVKNQFRFNEVGFDPSSRPSCVTSSDVAWDGATIAWESEAGKWDLQYKRVSQEEDWTVVSGLTDKTYRLTGLNEQTAYYVRVQDVDEEGHGGPWAMCGFRTPERYLAPTDVKILNINEHSVTVAWTDNAGATAWKVRVGNESQIVNTNPFIFSGLVPNKEYSVWVSADFGENGNSPTSRSVTFRTYAGANPAPKFIDIRPSATSPTLTWWGKSDKYVVKYRKNGTDDDWMTLETTAREITIPDLEPGGVIYQCQVIGIKAGYDDAVSSNTSIFSTWDINNMPRNNNVEAGYTTATIWWEGNSDAYIVQYWPNGTDNVKTAWTTVQEVKLTDLTPGTNYAYTITGLKSGYDDASTTPKYFTTQAEAAIDIELSDNTTNWNTIKDNEKVFANVTLRNHVFKKNGKWQAVCLPFDLRVKGSVLEGAEVRTLEAVQMCSRIAMLECYTPVEQMKAAKPYIIRWPAGSGSNIINPKFEGVTLSGTYPPSMSGGLKTNHVVFGGGYNYLLVTEEIMEELRERSVDYYMILGDPILEWAELGSEVRAFNGYFVVDNDCIEIDTVVLDTGEENDVITDISEVPSSESIVHSPDAAIYNLAGQRLQKLQKGINIVGGKKVAIK